MIRALHETPDHWISLGSACGLLGVNESTLRHWADSGRIRSFRTVGGHRRFAREDIAAFLERGAAPADRQDLADAVLKRFRRRIQSPRAPSPPLASLDDRSRARFRVMGRRLVELALRYRQDRRRRPQLLEDARFIGEEYGAEFARCHVGLSTALEAFVFHRSAAMATLRGLAQDATPGVARSDVGDLWQGMAELTDAVLLALAGSYEAPHAAPATPAAPGEERP